MLDGMISCGPKVDRLWDPNWDDPMSPVSLQENPTRVPSRYNPLGPTVMGPGCPKWDPVGKTDVNNLKEQINNNLRLKCPRNYQLH